MRINEVSFARSNHRLKLTAALREILSARSFSLSVSQTEN